MPYRARVSRIQRVGSRRAPAVGRRAGAMTWCNIPRLRDGQLVVHVIAYGRMAQGLSSSGRFTPLSFQGFRSALKLRADSIEMSDDFETLFEPLKKLLFME